MSLLSVIFLLFAAGVVVLYYLVPKRLQWVVLLVASLGFYASFGPQNLIFIFVCAAAAYGCCLCMDAIHARARDYVKAHRDTMTKEERTAYKKRQNTCCKWLMAATVLLAFGLLCVFKYADFALISVSTVFPSLSLPTTLSLVAPLGISFYTFQTVGYVADVYWEKVPAQRNPAKLLLFVSFFPQIIQGPISTYGQLSRELFAPHAFSYANYSNGVQRMLWGFFKKMVLADRAAPYVAEIFQNSSSYPGNNVLLGAFLYSFQIYMDFSGYMDIVAGLCEVLGIHLTENFDRPYFSKSVAEYWRRWHISLGAWFKTYLYYPIAVSRPAQRLSKKGSRLLGATFGKTLAASLALVVVWLTTGLWHGASFAYLAWGGLNGVFIILALWMKPVFDRTKQLLRVRESSFWYRAFATLRTFFLITLIKVFPEVGGFRGGIRFWCDSFRNWSLSLSPSRMLLPVSNRVDAVILALGAVLIFVTSLLQRRMSLRARLQLCPKWVRFAVFLLLLAVIIYYGIPTQSANGGFLYAQF